MLSAGGIKEAVDVGGNRLVKDQEEEESRESDLKGRMNLLFLHLRPLL